MNTRKITSQILLLIVLTIVLVGTGLTAAYWLKNRPTAKRRRLKPHATLVECQPVRLETRSVVIEAMGQVVPAQMIEFAPRVSGEVVWISPQLIEGGRFAAGETLLKVDPRDFELSVQQGQATCQQRSAETRRSQGQILRQEMAIKTAEAQLLLEMGQQAIAHKESEILEQTVQVDDHSLILRKPQLQIAEAAVTVAESEHQSAQGYHEAAEALHASAEVALEQAKLDLERTVLRAPFNAAVKIKNIDLGSQVSAGKSVATLVGTDEYWVRLSVPVDELRWINIPGLNGQTGSETRVHIGSEDAASVRRGTVARLLTDLEPQGRMARVLVAVNDPLNLEAPSADEKPLLLGMYPRVEIAGQSMPNIIVIPRSALRDGRDVWIMTPENTLEIRPVTILWSTGQEVYVSSGMSAGEQLIVSDLSSPVEGMALRTVGSRSADSNSVGDKNRGRAGGGGQGGGQGKGRGGGK